jgi:formyltetrahydrofolate-dependent phosphoribosylglycinamide formyltransferase/phosphoribosylaminoimidazole-succinocarboxamide synthase
MALRIAVMASTNGTDLQAIIDAIKAGELEAELRVVLANKDCYAIERAKNQGFKTKIILYDAETDTRESYDRKFAEVLDAEKIELIVLVGYMRIFSEWFVNKYKNRIINIHPSLLPAFPGMDRSVHDDVLRTGCKISGCTIHFVDEGVDTGPIIMQKAAEIEEGETVESLRDKVQALEKKAYPRVIQLFAERKISVEGRKVSVKEKNIVAVQDNDIAGEKEARYKEIIKKNLGNTLDSGYVPELGEHRKGKVRDVHFKSNKIGEPIIMLASDRVSSFDFILSKRVPFKGRVLNLLNSWAMVQTKDLVKNASMESPHPNVLVQRQYKNIMIECVVRGYVWGSLAGEYEAGSRECCGVKLPSGLLRYQKLDKPIFTPTTKATEHDAPLTFEQAEKMLGKELATKVREASIKLYERGSELASKAGLLFLDTKYEFGTDESGELYLIDEANTPDSSRYCSIEEYKKFESIKKEMMAGRYADVTQLLKDKPELKIKELSKQFIRDVLVEKGFGYGSSGEPPKLTDEDVTEVAYRYLRLYEQLTGRDFPFPEGNTRANVLHSLIEGGYIKGGLAVIIAGSHSDNEHIEKIRKELDGYGIKSAVRICSAHKQPALCEEIVKKYNESLEPIVFVSVAGGTDALSGVVSFHSVHPVISCPPNSGEYLSCLGNPSGSSNSLVLKPANVAKHVAQIFAQHNSGIKEEIVRKNEEKIACLGGRL